MRPIDADALKKAFCNHCDGDEPCTEPCVDIGLIETAKTIDAVPVVHGEWRRHKKGGIYCSVCKHDNHCGDVRLIMSYVQKFPICPWCGAKMDGKQ